MSNAFGTVEIGDGFTTAKRRGSVAHDEIEKNAKGAIVRRTDRAGGTEGGISTVSYTHLTLPTIYSV